MTVVEAPSGLDRLLAALDRLSPAQVREYVTRLPPDDVAVVERAIAERRATGWRSDPFAMASHLYPDHPRYQPYPYVQLLARKFRQLVNGESRRQAWVVPSRYGKPVSVDALILMGDGSRKRLGDVVVGDRVVTHRGRARRVSAVYEQGFLPTVEVRTGQGRVTRAAPDHPFLTAGGWVEAGKLKAGDNQGTRWGDVLATVVAARMDPATLDRTAEEFRLAGYFIGDGSVGTSTNSTISAIVTCFDAKEAVDLRTCAEAMGWGVTLQESRGRYSFRIGTSGKAAGPRRWLVESGIAGHSSWTKRVPGWVFTAPRRMVAEFVGAYFACDGTISGGPTGRAIEFYSVSEGLLRDVQHLLLRLRVPSSLSRKNALYGEQKHVSWRLRVIGRDGVARFAAKVPVHSAKAVRLAELDARRQVFDADLLADPVVSVEAVEETECRCLTVEEDGTFTADDLVVHNSTWGSQWGPAWALDRDPTTKIALTSYGDTLADENAVAVRDILVQHPDELHVVLRQDRKARDRFVTSAGGGLLAAGIGSGLTGFGAHGIVIDDPFKNWQEAHSQARREAVWNWYRSVVRLRLEEEDAWILVIQTRWHEEDLVGKLLQTDELGEGEDWDLTRITALAEEPSTKTSDPAWMKLPDPLGREPGEVIEARRFSKAAVLAKHKAIGSYLTAGMEQGRPAPEEGGEIKRAWWQWTTSPPGRFDQAITSWDMKLKEKKTGDYQVGQFWGRTGVDYWMLEQLRGQWNQPTIKAAIVLLSVRHPEAARHYVENTGNGPEVIAELKKSAPDYELSEEVRSELGMTEDEAERVQAVMRRGLDGIIPVNPEGDKVARARAESGVIEAGNVHLREGDPGAEYLVDESASFPTGTHDDAVDAMSQALKKLRAIGQASVSKPTESQMPSPTDPRNLDAAVADPGARPKRRTARISRPTGARIVRPGGPGSGTSTAPAHPDDPFKPRRPPGWRQD